MAKTLTLYTRQDCPLCDELAEGLHAVLGTSGHAVAPVDVDADPSLKAKYGWDVPLLFDGGAEICRHELDLPAIQEWLRANP
ncbi:MAG: glutaredoxin family protein [Betaproteobacteria bacterium]|nr:glutaredoxin family protein [Betaproteobacteria bacterium]